MTQRGSLRIHPMGIDGAITCFAPFHNVNCPKGFLYFNKQGELRISVLPTHLTYDAPWPIRKVPLRCTPHFVAYHVDSKVNMTYPMSLNPRKPDFVACDQQRHRSACTQGSNSALAYLLNASSFLQKGSRNCHHLLFSACGNKSLSIQPNYAAQHTLYGKQCRS